MYNLNQTHIATKLNNTYYLYPKNSKTYSRVLIWLPGLGESPELYLNLFLNSSMILPYPDTTTIIIPCAPLRRITAEKGLPMFSWFDVYDFEKNTGDSLNFNDVLTSSFSINQIIMDEAKKLNGNYKNIFLGGFSQGAIMSLYIGYSFPVKLGGIICCSGVLIPQTLIQKGNEYLPVFVSHGMADDTIFIQRNILSLTNIKHFPGIEIHYYPQLGHFIDINVLRDIFYFLRKYM